MRPVDVADGCGTNFGGGSASNVSVAKSRSRFGSVSDRCSGAISDGGVTSWRDADDRDGEDASPSCGLGIDGGSAVAAVGCEEAEDMGLKDIVKRGDSSCSTNSDVTYSVKETAESGAVGKRGEGVGDVGRNCGWARLDCGERGGLPVGDGLCGMVMEYAGSSGNMPDR